MRRLLFIVLPGILMAAAAIAIGYYDGPETPHAFTDSDCFLCHFTLPRAGERTTRPLRFTDAITKLCSRCHNMSEAVSHQVDMAPSQGITIPPDMPLDEQGHMTCITCHDIHKPYKNPLTGERTYFLRRDVLGKNFCITCHTSDEALSQIRLASIDPGSLGVIKTAISHKPAMDKAHGFARFEVVDPAAELDPLSLACLDCHNEPGEPGKTTLGAGIWRHAREGIGLSHPIGMDYHRSAMNSDELVPEKDLDKRVKLFSGKMGCCTCHDPYIPNDGQALVIGTHESFQDLCFACHIK